MTREDRFTAVYAAARRQVLGYALRRVADPADAADVVAEVFLVAWRRLDDLPQDDDALPWLIGVARRVLANHHRGQRHRLALADRLREQLHVAAVAGTGAADNEVEAALARLGDLDREMIRLYARGSTSCRATTSA